MRIICVMPPLPDVHSRTFSPDNVDRYLFARRSDTHLEQAYEEAYRRAFEDAVAMTGDQVIALHCDGPLDLYVGALDGYEAAGVEVQLLEYGGPGVFTPKPRYPKNGFMLDPEQAELVMETIDDKMQLVGHRAPLQAIRNGIAAALTRVRHRRERKVALPL